MKPIWLIATNLLREQRWPVIMLLLWVVVSGVLSGIGESGADAEDVIFFMKTQAVYGVVFVAFLAATAIHNDRKSRRILAVLSKGIYRPQYLAGLLLGVLMAGTVYCAATCVTGALLCQKVSVPLEALLPLCALLMAALVFTSTAALFFSTFLNPLFATAVTALAIGSPVLIAKVAGHRLDEIIPVYALMSGIMSFPAESFVWNVVLWAIVDAAAFWALAAWVFSYKDIAVAIE